MTNCLSLLNCTYFSHWRKMLLVFYVDFLYILRLFSHVPPIDLSIAHSTGCYNFQFSSVTQLCLTLFDPMDCSLQSFAVHHQLLELTQTHVHWVSDAIQPSHPLLSRSPPPFNLSQYQGLFKWVSSSHQVAKVLEFQLQQQSFQWIFRTGLL